jgi:hypothetical protein
MTMGKGVRLPLRLAFFILTVLVMWTAPSSFMVVDAASYYATLEPFGEYGRQTVQSGYVRVFTSRRHTNIIAYYGTVRSVATAGLRPDDAICTAVPNACGAHIHAGYSCNSTASQMGHLYDNITTPVDPWAIERYETDAYGVARYNGVVDQGTNNVEGRAFVVHNETGGRIACGILTLEEPYYGSDDDDDGYYYDDTYDPDKNDYDSFMCPPYSTVVRGIRYLSDFRESCRCREGFRRLGFPITCAAARSCDDGSLSYQCPRHARPKPDVSCLNSIRDCVCADGYRKKEGFCVASTSTSTGVTTVPPPHHADSTASTTTNYIHG